MGDRERATHSLSSNPYKLMAAPGLLNPLHWQVALASKTGVQKEALGCRASLVACSACELAWHLKGSDGMHLKSANPKQNSSSSWDSFDKNLKSIDSYWKCNRQRDILGLKDQSATVLWIWHFRLGWFFSHSDWLSSAINPGWSPSGHFIHGCLAWPVVIIMIAISTCFCYSASSSFFLLAIFFIYISNIIPFPSSPPPSQKHPITSSLPLLLWGCSSTHLPTPTSLPSIPLHWGIYHAFTGPRASPPTDDWQDQPLLHMQLEPCVLLGWWLLQLLIFFLFFMSSVLTIVWRRDLLFWSLELGLFTFFYLYYS
jgi:hypothetical protein